jgi:hypothetical protein
MFKESSMIQIMLPTMRTLNYSLIFSYPHDNLSKEEKRYGTLIIIQTLVLYCTELQLTYLNHFLFPL